MMDGLVCLQELPNDATIKNKKRERIDILFSLPKKNESSFIALATEANDKANDKAK